MKNFHPPNNYGSLAAAVFARTTALSFLGDFCVSASALHPPSMGISCPLYCHALVFLRVRFFGMTGMPSVCGESPQGA